MSPTLDAIRDRLSGHDPKTVPAADRPRFEAAVALVLRQGDSGGLELLFIERAEREGDPWSGQMAFPGGRRDPADDDLQSTAARETLEEVGLPLHAPIGALNHFHGTRNPQVRPLLVAPFVYAVESNPVLVENREVQSTVWVPLEWILNPESWAHHDLSSETQKFSFPAFRYQRYTVWGLTYRILRDFLALIGREIPSDGVMP